MFKVQATGWKGLPGTNAPAYLTSSVGDEGQKFDNVDTCSASAFCVDSRPFSRSSSSFSATKLKETKGGIRQTSYGDLTTFKTGAP
jgi:hypothetical protein